MNSVLSKTRFFDNLITAALLTLFVTGFGLFASTQIEHRNTGCDYGLIETVNSANCKTEKIQLTDSGAQLQACQCPTISSLAVSNQ